MRRPNRNIKRNTCPNGYIMSNGVCRRRFNKPAPRQLVGATSQRTPQECCSDLNARYECKYNCTNCTQWDPWSQQWFTSPGADCYNILEVISDCPAGAQPSFTHEACMNKLEAFHSINESCLSSLGGQSYSTVSGNCGCTAWYQYLCPGQNPVDCDDVPPGTVCNPGPKAWRRGGRINRGRR